MNSPTPNLNSPEINIQNQALPAENPVVAFAPLPIRARTTLEVLDVSVKLYRRYFGVLMLWSLLTAGIYVISSFIPFLYVLAMPLIYGSVSCAIAAAVRGEKITFGQVWDFTKPRYGALIGVLLLSFILFGIGVGGFCILAAIIFGLGVYVLDAAPEPIQVVGAIVGFIALFVSYSLVCAVAFGWLNLVPIVACLEDDKRGTAAMGRAWTLFSGHWKRVLTITVLLGIAILIFFGIVAGFFGFVGMGTQAFLNPESSSFWVLMLGMTAIAAVFSLFWTPAQALVIAVLYLDLRVRKEALDIEWTDYASKAPATPTDNFAPQTGAVANTYPVEMATGVQELSPSSFGAGQNVVTPTPEPTQGFSPLTPQSIVPPVEAPPQFSGTTPNPFVPSNLIPQEVSPEPPVAPPIQSSQQVEFATPPQEISLDKFVEPVKEQPTETSSFAPPAFSFDTSPWGASATPTPTNEPPSTDVSSFGIQPNEPKSEDSHEPRF